MRNQKVFFLDLQTTGARPGDAFILEIAVAVNNDTVESFLVELPREYELQPRIQMVTGIKPEEMVHAVAFPEAMQRLIQQIPTDAVAVIHFAQFEKPFLEAAFKAINQELHFEIICTNEIARRLFPNLPSRGIKALAGFFGHDSGDFKRSAGHVEATRIIWNNLLSVLEKLNVHTFSDYKNWLEQTPKAKKTRYEYPLSKEIRLALPDSPGVYRMLNRDGKVLYVGKATSLHSRVNSYFRGQKGRDSFKLEMLAQVHDIKVTVCDSPLHAALLETDEIKRLNPYYNIALKEGKRELAFFDRTFTSVTNTRDDIHQAGPFSSPMVFDSLICLSDWLKNDGPESLPPSTMFYEELDPELIREGFLKFASEHHLNPLRFSSMRSIIVQGLIWLRRETEAAGEVEIEVETETETETETELTASDIAAKFKRHFIRAGAAYIRARTMNRLMNAKVEFRLKNRKKAKIQLINGQLPEDGKQALSESEVWQYHAIPTYDRLTVLLTELNKIEKFKFS